MAWRGRATKQSRDTRWANKAKQPHRDDCKTRMDTQLYTAKHKTIKESHNKSNSQQRINNNRASALERTAAKAPGGQQGISEPIFYGDLIYKYKRVVGKPNLSYQLKRL